MKNRSGTEKEQMSRRIKRYPPLHLKKYEKKAKEDKERYDRQMREYQSKQKEEGTGPSTSKTTKSPTKTTSPTKKPISKEFVPSSDSSDSD
jgi:hypothetical protein